MGWADFAKEALRRGETVKVKPRGHSMKGKVNDGDIVTLQPCNTSDLFHICGPRESKNGLAALRFGSIYSTIELTGWATAAAVFGCAGVWQERHDPASITSARMRKAGRMAREFSNVPAMLRC